MVRVIHHLEAPESPVKYGLITKMMARFADKPEMPTKPVFMRVCWVSMDEEKEENRG